MSWIGVDLDGTLAKHGGWQGIYHIGEPIEPMVALVKQWLVEGKDVRIFTARVTEFGQGINESKVARQEIYAWCEKHIGRILPVTNVKDYDMEILYDDRARQVEMNTGRIIGE